MRVGLLVFYSNLERGSQPLFVIGSSRSLNVSSHVMRSDRNYSFDNIGDHGKSF
jgi:hypothetical protein